MNRMMNQKYHCFVQQQWTLQNNQKNQEMKAVSPRIQGFFTCKISKKYYMQNNNIESHSLRFFIDIFTRTLRCSCGIKESNLRKNQHGFSPSNLPNNNVTTTEKVHSAIQTLKEALCCWSSSIMPVVYAETGPLESAVNNEELTTMDRLIHRKLPESKFYVTNEEVEKFIASQTGKDRIKLLFKGVETPYGSSRHPDTSLYLSLLRTVIFSMFAVGSIHSAYQRRKRGSNLESVGEEFNKEKAVKMLRAHRSLANEAFFSGFRWAMRGVIGLTVVMGSLVGIATYRNKSGYLEMAVGGGICGGISGIYRGSQVFLKHIAVGIAIGTVTGYLMLLERRRTGYTQEEQNYSMVQRILESRKLREDQKSKMVGEENEVSHKDRQIQHLFSK